MSVRFLAGRAGSGKTAQCLAEIAAECRRAPEGPPLLLIAPEQATYEAERALVERTGGYIRARVLSFTRLLEVLTREFPPSALPRLGPAQRALLVARIVQRRRADAASPGLFRVRGIEESLLAFLSEAGQCLVEPERLRAAAERSGLPGLSEKSDALAMFLDDFRALVRERFEDPHETMRVATVAVLKSDLLLGATLWLDGFHGFTPAEEGVLASLMLRCRRTTITLTISPERMAATMRRDLSAPSAVFHPVEETVGRLLALVGRSGAKLEEPEILPARPGADRFGHSPGHTWMERAFLDRAVGSRSEAPARMRLMEAESRRDEAWLAVETVRDWITRDGIDPGRIAIVARSLEGVAEAMEEALNALGVAHFIDRNMPLEAHPIVQAITAATRCASRGWSAEDVLEFARTGLAGVSRDEADTLHAWCLANPPRPADWRARGTWRQPPPRSFSEDDPEAMAEAPPAPEIDRVRRIVAARLTIIAEPLSQDDGVPFASATAAASEFVRACLAERSLPRDEEDEAVLERLAELFDDADAALGAETMAAADAADTLIAVLGLLALPRIPPALGQVLVAQADRSRFPPLDAVVLVGWNAGEFPVRARNRTLLNDAERAELLQRKLEVMPPAREMFLRESFLAYLALTRTAGPILVTRALGFEREPAAPSPFWEELLRIFPNLPVERAPSRHGLERARRARDVAAAVWNENAERAEEILAEADAAETSSVLRAARDMNTAQFEAGTLHAEHKGKWGTSVSGLESYSRCPFRHFVANILRPAEPKPAEADARDVGTLAHAILANLAKMLAAERLDFATPLREAMFERAAEGPVEHARRIGIFQTEAGTQLLEATVAVTRAHVEWLAAASAVIGARPIFAEARFGGDDGAFPAVELFAQADGFEWEVAVRGQIDRVDVAEGPQGKFILVADYKLRGGQKFDFSKWRAGLAFQLPMYLLAVTRGFPDAKAGAGVYSALVPETDARRALANGDFGASKLRGLARASFYESAMREQFPWGRMKFIEGASTDPGAEPSYGTAVSESDFETILESTFVFASMTMARMLSGDADPRPAQEGGVLACEKCDYRPICRFDASRNETRVVAKISRAAAIRELREGAPE